MTTSRSSTANGTSSPSEDVRILLQAMIEIQSHEIDETLLLLSETRERAERAARKIGEVGGQEHVVEALQRVDRELLALHRRLMDEAVFGMSAAAAAEVQLALDAR